MAACTREIETGFLETPMDLLAQWLDWSDGIPRAARAETQRLVEDAGLLTRNGEQNSAQGCSASATVRVGKAVRVGH